MKIINYPEWIGRFTTRFIAHYNPRYYQHTTDARLVSGRMVDIACLLEYLLQRKALLLTDPSMLTQVVPNPFTPELDAIMDEFWLEDGKFIDGKLEANGFPLSYVKLLDDIMNYVCGIGV